MKQKGFTLIELLVTMGIIAVLTGLAVFNFNQARVRARDVQRKSDLSQLAKAFELYKNDNNGQYILTDGISSDKSVFMTTLIEDQYTKTTFVDPKGSSWSSYEYICTDAKTYYLMTCLENVADTSKASADKCALFQPNGVNPSGVDCACGESYKGVMYITTNP